MQSFSIVEWLTVAAIIGILIWLIARATRKSKAEAQSSVVGPSGIGGWLILLAIGIVLSPIRTLSVFADEMQAYMKIKSEYSIPNIETAEKFEVVLLLGLVVLQAIVAFVFFLKKRYFPIWYLCQWVATLCVSLAVIVVPLVIIGAPWQAGFTPEALGGLIAILVVGGIWVTYVFRSVRVRNTFVRR